MSRLYIPIKKSTCLKESPDFSNIRDVGDYGFYYILFTCSNITSVDLSNLTTVSGINGCNSMFTNCTNLTSVDLSSLTTISQEGGCASMFASCTNLTSVNLSSLTTISGQNGCYSMFSQCPITSINLSSLTTISGQYGCYFMFSGCTNIESISFPALTTSSFGSYTNQFYNMMSSTGTTKIHTIHFPSNLQSTIAGLTGYPLFGGTSGYVTLAFDLPATNIGCCVAPDSEILYADGSTKRADEVQVGDIIKGYNEATNTFCDVNVLQIRTPIREGLIRIIFEDDSYIDVTPDHPLFASTGWQAYDLEQARINYHDDIESEITQMAVGSQLLQYGGSYKTIKSIQVLNIEGTLTAYTFDTTSGIDTYISNGCVSHNHGI